MRLTPERERDILFGLYNRNFCDSILKTDVEILFAEIDALREDARIWEEKAYLWMVKCDSLESRYEPKFGTIGDPI